MKKYDPETVEMFELRLYDKNKSGKYWSWKYKRVETNLSSFIVDGDIIFSGNEKRIQTKAAKEHHGIENDDIYAQMIVTETNGDVTEFWCVDWNADVLEWEERRQ